MGKHIFKTLHIQQAEDVNFQQIFLFDFWTFMVSVFHPRFMEKCFFLFLCQNSLEKDPNKNRIYLHLSIIQGCLFKVTKKDHCKRIKKNNDSFFHAGVKCELAPLSFIPEDLLHYFHVHILLIAYNRTHTTVLIERRPLDQSYNIYIKRRPQQVFFYSHTFMGLTITTNLEKKLTFISKAELPKSCKSDTCN